MRSRFEFPIRHLTRIHQLKCDSNKQNEDMYTFNVNNVQNSPSHKYRTREIFENILLNEVGIVKISAQRMPCLLISDPKCT